MLMILVSGIFAALFLNVQSFNKFGGAICLKENQLKERTNATPISFSDQNVPESFDTHDHWPKCRLVRRVITNSGS